MSRPPESHPRRTAPEGPTLVVVMDGVGLGDGGPGDAVKMARTPTLDWLGSLPSSCELLAHGRAVGMPSDKDMGNSEVGHNALGAGRIFEQGASLVNQAIESGRLFEGEAWKRLVAQVRESGEAMHFIGLLSDGNVHSHIEHLFALLRRASAEGVAKVRVHALLDGRDVPARSALEYTDRLEAVLTELCNSERDYRVASGGGRMHITMDRYEADWSMVERGWRHHVEGAGQRFASLREAVSTLYERSDKGDQDLGAFVIASDGEPVGPIRDGASVVLFNFRGDRAIEISRAFEERAFSAFERGTVPDVAFAGMMEYDGDLHIPSSYLVQPPAIAGTMGELLASAGKTQLAIAETQKYGHVTYFWNGNRSGRFDEKLERYIEIASDLLPFEQRPWMKAAEVTDALIEALDERPFDLTRVNYANGDMVGHTGDLEATILAVESVDLCLARLVAETKRRKGVLVVTADHGNADQMFDGTGEARRVRTSHSLNRVPFCIFDPREAAGGPNLARQSEAGLANVAATVFELLGLSSPAGYAPSLLSEG